MPSPGEYKTVQARILAYAQATGWTYVPRAQAERRRGFDHSKATPAEQAAGASPYFDDLLDAQVRNQLLLGTPTGRVGRDNPGHWTCGGLEPAVGCGTEARQRAIGAMSHRRQKGPISFRFFPWRLFPCRLANARGGPARKADPQRIYGGARTLPGQGRCGNLATCRGPWLAAARNPFSHLGDFLTAAQALCLIS